MKIYFILIPIKTWIEIYGFNLTTITITLTQRYSKLHDLKKKIAIKFNINMNINKHFFVALWTSFSHGLL